MVHKFRLAFAMIAAAFLSVAAYIILHEAGHALVAAFCGAKNIKISILRAHTWWTDGSFTAVTSSLCHAAGTALPVCVSYVGLFFYSGDRKSPVYRMAYPYLVVTAVSAASVWVLFPIYSMFAPLPDTEDVAKFLHSSGIPPIIVSLAGAMVVLFGVFVAKRRRIFPVWIQTVKQIRDGGEDRGARRSNQAMIGIAAAVLITAFVAVLPELPDFVTKPILSLTVTDEIPETETQMIFDIPQEKQYRFQIQLDAEGLLADVRILDSEQEPVYQMLSGQASAEGTLSLTPGTYTLTVTFLTDADLFEHHCDGMGYRLEEAEWEACRAVYEQEALLSRLCFVLQ